MITVLWLVITGAPRIDPPRFGRRQLKTGEDSGSGTSACQCQPASDSDSELPSHTGSTAIMWAAFQGRSFRCGCFGRLPSGLYQPFQPCQDSWCHGFNPGSDLPGPGGVTVARVGWVVCKCGLLDLGAVRVGNEAAVDG